MKHAQATTAQTSGKSQMLVLLVIGILGAIGLFYVLNSSSDKTGFSSNEAPAKMEQAQQVNQTGAEIAQVVLN